MEYLHIQIDNELKETLKKEAEAKGLSLNSYVRMLLIERGKWYDYWWSKTRITKI